MTALGTTGRPQGTRDLPRPAAGLAPARRLAAVGLGLVGLPALTLVLDRAAGELALGSVLLLYLLAVVVVAAVGGIWPAVAAAAASVLVANWFFTSPVHTFVVEGRDAVVELVVFAVVALIVSATVEYAARDRARATRSRAEADLLSAVATRPLDDLRLPEILDTVRATFAMTAAALVRSSGGSRTVVAVAGRLDDDAPRVDVPVSAELTLVVQGPALADDDLVLLERLAAAAARAWEAQHLAAHADRLSEADRVRSALLAAVGHDLRTPLSSLKAAVSSLTQHDVAWSEEEQAELLATVEESTDRLAARIADILDLTRIQAGSVPVHAAPVTVDEVAAAALLDAPRGAVVTDLPDHLPLVTADAVLLQRVIANLVDNAVRHSPPGKPVEVVARLAGDHVRLRVTDHGPGVPAELWPAMFAPFQRLGDRATGSGAGLGLAIVEGFCAAMAVPVRPSTTPGGGLTMTLHLSVAAR